MSRYATPFLVLNLGSEMIFVVAQRLGAQAVPRERATFVLDEITSVLLSVDLISNLMRPQTVYSHEQVRNVIEDVAQSSIMRLDPVSMDKLWDLITMVFKWQLTFSSDVVAVTSRHLDEVLGHVTRSDTKLQLSKVQSLVRSFGRVLDREEQVQLREDILLWLQPCNVKVSLLLKLGLQAADGTFVANNAEGVREMFDNLGENIYSVTQNGENLNRSKNNNDIGTTSEVDLLVGQLMGEKPKASAGDRKHLKLNINNIVSGGTKGKRFSFEAIEVVQCGNQLGDLLDELNMNENPEEGNFREDLLEMIDTNVTSNGDAK